MMGMKPSLSDFDSLLNPKSVHHDIYAIGS